MNDIYILDACAVIALIKKETGWGTVFDTLRKTITENTVVFMHEVNLLEVYYGFYKERGKEYAEQKLFEVSGLVSTVSGLTPAVFTEAGRLKSAYKISLADSIALAEAAVLGATLLTADHHEFDVIEPLERINFLWIR